MTNDTRIMGANILPHREPFLYLDWIINYSKRDSVGQVTFGAERDFFRGHFISRGGGAHKPLCIDFLRETVPRMNVPYLQMDGHAVYAFAVRKLAEVVSALCKQVPISSEALDLIIPHQANYRILEAVARRMAFPLEKFYIHLKDVGNTSSASIPLCLDKAVREGTLRPGMRLALAGFGSGLTWAGLLAEWPYL